MAKTIERPKTKDVQEFWTKFPMTFGVTEDEVKKCGAEAVWVSTERTTLQKLVHLEDEKGRFLGSVIDWDWLTGKHALEIGYGTAWFTNMIAQYADRVDGVDLSESHYAVSSERFRNHQSVTLQIGSAEELPFASNTFDFVAAWGVLHHAENDIACYREVYRVLKPGGRCFLMLYRKGGPKYWWRKIVRKGVLQGGLWRYRWDVEKFIESVTDAYTPESPGAPISRHYKRDELLRRLTDDGRLNFKKIKLQVSGNTREWRDFPFGKLPISNILPEYLARYLVSR